MQQNYKLTQEYFKKLEQRFYWIVIPAFLVPVLAGIFWGVYQSGFNIISFVTVLFISIYIAFSSRKFLIQQKKSWASYRIILSEDKITRMQEGYETIEIRKDEVTKIIEDTGGSLIVKTKAQNKQIIIPVSLEDYSKMQTFLNSWQTIVTTPSQNKTNIVVIFIVTILSVVGLGIIWLEKNKLLVITLGFLFLIALTSNILYVRNNNQLDIRTKHSVWWVLLPITFILIRMYSVIFLP